MFSSFFQTAALPLDQYYGQYNLYLVFLSFMVASAASYIALNLTAQLRDISNTLVNKWLWLVGGSVAMGAGIWSMHFIGMLSFSIPGLALQYDLFWTGLSLVVAIIASFFALWLFQTPALRIEHYIAGGTILGVAIASMHYTGMEAMLISLNIHYLPLLFITSIVIAIVASEAAIWLALKSTLVIPRIRSRIKFISALIMGIAICGMHYTGMASSVFTPLCAFPSIYAAKGMDQTYLSIAIAGVTFVILGIALLASMYRESMNLQMVEHARQLGMAEISASVLHNVGNVLNSVGISTDILTDKILHSKLQKLENVAEMLNAHKADLATYLTKDPKGRKIIEFISLLAVYWHEEQQAKAQELTLLQKNIDLITEIISTQQSLSKQTAIEQMVSVNELLDEALLIVGFPLKSEILINKSYDKISPIRVDKSKLLQILVNLLKNAKDAVLESSRIDKVITITTRTLKQHYIQIEITDNGIGILPEHVNKIFIYGFTTKKSGHGFGLHASAIDLNNLGGKIQVHSEGFNQGATITVELLSKL